MTEVIDVGGAAGRFARSQLHPARIAADAIGAGAGLWFLWDHRLLPGIFLIVGAPLVVALLVARVGREASRADTTPFQLVRLAGLATAAYAAWAGAPWLLAAAFVVFVAGFGSALAGPPIRPLTRPGN
jgi:hypothetical protein